MCVLPFKMSGLSRRVTQGLLQKLLNSRSAPTILLRKHHVLRPTYLLQTPNLTTTIARYKSTDDLELERKQKHQLALDANFDEDPEKASGKTVVNILNHETEEGIFFTSYSCQGFRISNGMRVMGPCAVFPRSILHWNVSGVRHVNEASLRLFTLLEPKLDILLLGVGERENIKLVDPEIIKFLRAHRLNVEVLATDQALATFNFMNSEKRYVAGAFIPPSYVDEDRFDDGNTRFSNIIERDEARLFNTKSDYDHIPPGHEEGITEDMWEKRADSIKEKIYQSDEREKDMKENPGKYRE